jgi:hypothetical protein
MSTGHPTGHGPFWPDPGEAPAAPDTDRKTPGQATGQSTGHTGTPEHRRTSPPLVGGVCRSDRWVDALGYLTIGMQVACLVAVIALAAR